MDVRGNLAQDYGMWYMLHAQQENTEIRIRIHDRNRATLGDVGNTRSSTSRSSASATTSISGFLPNTVVQVSPVCLPCL